jgi:hypothetical protein
VVTFSIAINSRRFDRDKGHWVTRPKVERTAASSPPTRASAAPSRSRSADPPLGRGPALRGRATRPSPPPVSLEGASRHWCGSGTGRGRGEGFELVIVAFRLDACSRPSR